MKNKLFLFLVFSMLSVAYTHSQIGGFSEPVLLDKKINTESEETRPVISNDGTKIYFTRTFDENSTGGLYDQDIWFAEIKDGEVSKCTPISEYNNKFNNSIVGISKDGESLYLLDAYSGKKDEKKGCAIAIIQDDNWGKPTHLDIPDLDIDGDFYGFYITKNEKVIVISYAGPNSIGEEDLYISINENDSWGKPIHLGSKINTSGFEISPYLNETLDTLFFSSNGRGGEGDADIFFSRREGDSWTEWSEPENLGSVINSPKFDAFFTINGNTAYWSSNKESERSDIYSATILPPPPIDITTDIKMPSSFEATDGEVNITISSGKGPFSVLWSDGSTELNRTGLAGGQYSVTITDKFGISKTIELEVEKPEMKQKDLDNLLVNVNPIYFDLNKHKIRDDGKIELDKIIKIMNDNPTIQIELGSHTDCISSARYNMRLSNKRAKSSAEYIKDKISNPERISGQGYGETMLKVDCPCEGKIKSTCSDDEHQMNRRTEFILIEEGSPKYADIKVEQVKPSNTNNTVEVDYNTDASNKTKWKTEIPVTEEQRKNIENGFYIVQYGETLYRVAVNTGITTNELRRINNLKSNSIKPGTKLKLK
jgi:OmpA-OmpF porin, OOP family